MSYNRSYYLKRREDISRRTLGNYHKKDGEYVKATFEAIKKKFGFSEEFIRKLLLFNTKTEILHGRIIRGKFKPKEMVKL